MSNEDTSDEVVLEKPDTAIIPVKIESPDESVSTETRLVAYADGGARPNPGKAGWGFHGYLYHPTVPKKGSGNPQHVLTDFGYVLKEDVVSSNKKHRSVTPISYVDAFGSIAYDTSNQIAELNAALNVLVYAASYAVTLVRIYTDSEYTKNGMESWTKTWIKHNWRRSNGTEIANVEEWKKLIAARDQLTDRGCKVEFHWIKGHSDQLGNDKADTMATLGVMHAKRGVVTGNITQTTAEGYWKYDTNAHPFLSLPAIYYNTRDTIKRGEYYLGNQYKEIELLGKRISDGAFAVVRLKDPDPAIDIIQSYQVEMAHGTDNVMMMRLDQLYRPSTHFEITTYGKYATNQPNPHQYDLECLDEEPLSRELRKPKLAFRAIENISELGETLDRFLIGDAEYITTDLTPILYETTVKVDKKGGTTSKMELKSAFKVGFAALEVEANYGQSSLGELASAKVILTLGIDLLDRNRLKRLEARNPKITLVTRMSSEVAFRHYTVIQAGDDVGIWAGMYSNVRLLPNPVLQQVATS